MIQVNFKKSKKPYEEGARGLCKDKYHMEWSFGEVDSQRN